MAVDRKAFYSALEKIEGSEDVKAMAKTLFEGSDAESKKYREASEGFEKQLETLSEDMDGLKIKLDESTTNTVPKTEMEKQMLVIQKTLDGITKERDDERSINEKNTAEKKQGALEKHFFDSVSESFGAVGAGDAVAVSLGKLGYSESGEMEYGGKIGDDAVELFKTDNSRFTVNRGTSTSGGTPTNSNPSAKPAETSFKGFQNVAKSMG